MSLDSVDQATVTETREIVATADALDFTDGNTVATSVGELTYAVRELLKLVEQLAGETPEAGR